MPINVWFNKTVTSIETAMALIKSADTNNEFNVIFTHPNENFRGGLVADQFFVEPSEDEVSSEEYIGWALQFCKDKNIQVFSPGRCLQEIARPDNIALFEAIGVRLMIPSSYENIDLIEVKSKFYSSIDLPDTPPAKWESFRNVAEFDAAYENMSKCADVLCVKPSVGIFGNGFAILDEHRTMAQVMAGGFKDYIPFSVYRDSLIDVGDFEEMMLIEYLPYAEYSVDCVAIEGELLAGIQRRKPLKMGLPYTIMDRADLHEACQKLAKEFRLTGNFNAQFKDGTDGKTCILEINPRISGGIGMACLAGPNLPYIALKAFCHGLGSVDVPEIKVGLLVGEKRVPLVLGEG